MFNKRDKKDDCIISGYVVADQKVKEYNDKTYVEFGISMGKDENGDNLPIVNISVWDRTIPTIFKGDRVFAAGKLKATKKDDKVYYSLTADFCIKEVHVENVPKMSEKEQDELTEIDDDLPF